MPRVYHQMTPEEMRASEARFTKLMNDTRAAAELDPTHPSRPYFGLPMAPQPPPVQLDDQMQDDNLVQGDAQRRAE